MLRSITTLTIVLILFPVYIFSQSGKVFDNESMQSKILNMERKYAVYLPPDYETSQRSYPVLYLLHGSGDDQTGWVQFGEVLRITDEAINKGEVTPMIIIMPDATSGKPGYFNDADGSWRYEDFFFQELIPFVEKKFRIKGEKRYRAVAGLSMGGEGTYTYALHHPEMFSSACPLSAATGPSNIADLKRYLEKRKRTTNIEDSLAEPFYKRQSVLALIDELPVDQIKSVRWYIDCGDDDFLYEGNSLVHIALRKKEINHEFRIRNGGHTWTYWRSALPSVLSFISEAFHQN